MPTLLITYDIADDDARAAVLTTIRRRAWAKLTESAYAVDTDESAQELYADLLQHCGTKDRLIVVGLARPFIGYTTEEIANWVGEKLP